MSQIERCEITSGNNLDCSESTTCNMSTCGIDLCDWLVEPRGDADQSMNMATSAESAESLQSAEIERLEAQLALCKFRAMEAEVELEFLRKYYLTSDSTSSPTTVATTASTVTPSYMPTTILRPTPLLGTTAPPTWEDTLGEVMVEPIATCVPEFANGACGSTVCATCCKASLSDVAVW